jgi:hypothetical protein
MAKARSSRQLPLHETGAVQIAVANFDPKGAQCGKMSPSPSLASARLIQRQDVVSESRALKNNGDAQQTALIQFQLRGATRVSLVEITAQ